ncbi:hypothetical protein SAMN04487845_14520 [Methylobacterium sp. yr668]|nr:hypothetical protein SAMN04487845_14520 [Methylobacterium sp. yr668]
MLNRLLQRSNDGSSCGGEIMTARIYPTCRTAARLTACQAGDRERSRQCRAPETMADLNRACDAWLKKGV